MKDSDTPEPCPMKCAAEVSEVVEKLSSLGEDEIHHDAKGVHWAA